MSHNPLEPSSAPAISPWLASILMRRGGALPRFALAYQRLAAMPRRWRRQLWRRAAVGLAGTALALALAGPLVAAPAAAIAVVNGEVADVSNGRCGLVEAIRNAVATEAGQRRPDCAAGHLSGPDTVVLPEAGLFVLTEPAEYYGSNGLPGITTAVTIEGHGATIRRSAVSGTPDFRILEVEAEGALTLLNVAIEGGYLEYGYEGGGIRSVGSLTLDGVTVTGNRLLNVTSTRGGGIYASGPLTVTNSTISHNGSFSRSGVGGGIYTAGPLAISDSVISNNSAAGMRTGAGGGVHIHHAVSDATISRSRIVGNMVGSYYSAEGAGVSARGHVTITDSLIAGNVNRGDTDGGHGGGLAVWGGAEIRGSTISGNVVESPYQPTSNNYAGRGGGLFGSGDILIVNSTISNNLGALGGGLAVSGRNVTIVQSTISGNVAQITTPDSSIGGQGGGIFIEAYKSQAGTCHQATLRGVLVAGNAADLAGPEIALAPVDGCQTPIHVDAFNLLGHSGAAGLAGLSPGPSDIVPTAGLSAILAPLAWNGGPTPTQALVEGSPALDRVLNARCSAAPVDGIDQRGWPRNIGAGDPACDVGAFEWQADRTGRTSFLPSVRGR